MIIIALMCFFKIQKKMRVVEKTQKTTLCFVEFAHYKDIFKKVQ